LKNSWPERKINF